MYFQLLGVLHYLLCVMDVQLSAEVVLDSGAALPVVQVTVLVLKLALVAVKDGVFPTLQFDEIQEFLVVPLVVWVQVILLWPCWVYGMR